MAGRGGVFAWCRAALAASWLGETPRPGWRSKCTFDRLKLYKCIVSTVTELCQAIRSFILRSSQVLLSSRRPRSELAPRILRRSRSVRCPWLRLGLWIAVVAVLALLGSGIAARLAPTSVLIPGTPSARAQAMLERQFGNSIPITVLLRGPARAIDRQGPHLVAALRDQGRVAVMSPWDSASAIQTLRPRPDVALIVAGFERPASEEMSVVVPSAERLVREDVRAPLRADVGGIAAIAAALQRDALDATSRAEMLAMPILVIVLLLVFRTPVAAAIPLLMGGATVLAGRGLLCSARTQCRSTRWPSRWPR